MRVVHLAKQNLPEYDKKMVKKYGKTFGTFDGTLPNLFTIDADLIKSIFVKDFDHFVNRRVNCLVILNGKMALHSNRCVYFKKQDFTVKRKIFRKMLSIIQNKEWKDVRSSVTPVFTTGKIKQVRLRLIRFARWLIIPKTISFLTDVGLDNRMCQSTGSQISKGGRKRREIRC